MLAGYAFPADLGRRSLRSGSRAWRALDALFDLFLLIRCGGVEPRGFHYFIQNLDFSKNSNKALAMF